MKKEYLVSAKEMKQLDNNTIDKTGLPSLVLMERAAVAVAESVREFFDFEISGRILVIAGNGNNGADGVCAGRILKEYGYDVTICVLSSGHEYTDEMKLQMKAASIYDIPFVKEEELDLNAYDVIIDSIFGIGLNRNIEGSAKDIIEKMNESDCHVISVDIPSGINATTGSVCGVAVKADETVTFGFYKCGQCFYPGRTYCGKIKKAYIAINETSFYDLKPGMFTYFPEKKGEKLDFSRSSMGNKGTFGKVFVIAGRLTTAGAALLCASSALRSGCGMIAVMTEAENKEAFLSSLPEAMLETYSSQDSKEVISDKIKKWLAWADVVVIGCGLGRDEVAYRILHDTVCNLDKPMVCDADALQLFAAHDELKADLKKRVSDVPIDVVFTPHPGELAALAHCGIEEVKENKAAVAESVCEEYSVTLIAKDADTMCVKMGEAKYLNMSGNDGMATAGSGDVLAGLTASFIAQSKKAGMSILDAVCHAVYLHGCAGDVCAKQNGKRFLVASDIIEAYKYILK